MTENFASVTDPRDLTYHLQRQEQIDELLRLSPQQLDRRLQWQLNSPAIRDDHGVSKNIVGDIINAPTTPVGLQKGILDSTVGTTGSYLIRQDLEPTLYAYAKLRLW